MVTPRRVGLLALMVLWFAGHPAAAQGERRFPAGIRVEVDGRWSGEWVDAIKVVVEEPDDFPEIKGYASEIDVRRGIIVIPPFTIEVTAETDIDDAEDEGDSYRLDELQEDWRLEVEGELRGDRRFRALQIDVERSAEKLGIVELEGFVSEETIEGGIHQIVVLGIPCRIHEDTILPTETFRKATKRRPIEDQRPEDQLVLFDRLTIGGEVQFDMEYEDNYNLDAHRNRDRVRNEYTLTLEAQLQITDRSYAFARMRTGVRRVAFDEDREDQGEVDDSTRLEQLNLYWEELFDQPVAIEVGRQRYDERREWLFDENIDGVRLYWRPGDFEVEYSWSVFLADAPMDFDERLNQILLARWNFADSTFVAAYMIDIQDDSRRDDSPFFVGLRLFGNPRPWMFWSEISYVDGVDGPNEIEGYGVDVGAGHQFIDLPLGPYVYAGYAVGSGDDRTAGSTDRNYRQTGYQDNNDRFFGVASFRYYGELLRPELSNLHIFTVGAGIRPVQWLSLDLLYHHYRQDAAAPFLRDSELDAAPNGRSREIGEEFDLVFGLDKIFGQLDVELDLGYFRPGSAFDDDDDGLWVALKLEWNF